jgi:hypothetical protein
MFAFYLKKTIYSLVPDAMQRRYIQKPTCIEEIINFRTTARGQQEIGWNLGWGP